MPSFKCNKCGLKCQLNKKLSELRNKEDKDRIHVWECPGTKADSPHPPALYLVEPITIMTDAFGRVTVTIDKITQLMLEDSNLHELTDQWREWMREERYKRLKTSQEEQPATSQSS